MGSRRRRPIPSIQLSRAANHEKSSTALARPPKREIELPSPSKARASTKSQRAFAFSITCSSSSPGTAASIVKLSAQGTSTSISITPSKTSASRSARPLTRARRPPRHQSRRIFPHADGRHSGSAAIDLGGRAVTVVQTKVRTPKVGDLQTEFVTTSSRASRMPLAPTFTSSVIYGRRAITRSNRSSRLSPAPCVSPVGAKDNACACCRPPRDCCDQTRRRAVRDDRADRLQCRQSQLGPESIRRRSRRRCYVTTQPEAIATAGKIILPGVGHFSALSGLDNTGLREAVLRAAKAGKPLLGICLGMQWLFEGSDEAPEFAGVGLFPAAVSPFRPRSNPHTSDGTLSPF